MERWLSYKGTCHVILIAKLHDMYLYKTATFPHQPQKSVSKVAFLHRFHCIYFVGLKSHLLCAKFEGHLTYGSEEDLKRFLPYMSMMAILVM